MKTAMFRKAQSLVALLSISYAEAIVLVIDFTNIPANLKQYYADQLLLAFECHFETYRHFMHR